MSWSRRQWFTVMSLILIAHLAAVFALHSRAPLLARVDSAALRRPQTTSSEAPAIPAELQDPLVFASANPHGFSGAAWVREPASKYELARTETPPRFLRFEREPTSFPPAQTPPPRTPLPFISLQVPTPQRQSTFAIEGDLAARPLHNPPTLPPQFHTDVLGNTVVQLGVQSDGFPFSVRLVASSGLKKADLDALEIAKNLRFAPRPLAGLPRTPAPLEWGELVIQWFAAAPGSTNVAAATPK